MVGDNQGFGPIQIALNQVHGSQTVKKLASLLRLLQDLTIDNGDNFSGPQHHFLPDVQIHNDLAPWPKTYSGLSCP
jgi:hypothetical protein